MSTDTCIRGGSRTFSIALRKFSMNRMTVIRNFFRNVQEFCLNYEIVKTVNVANDPMSDIGKCDLVVLSTKADGVKPSIPLVKALLGDCDSGYVLAMQNGIGAPRLLLEQIPASKVLVGVAAAFGASMKGPGHAFHNGKFHISFKFVLKR